MNAALTNATALNYAQTSMEVMFAHVNLVINWEPITSHAMVSCSHVRLEIFTYNDPLTQTSMNAALTMATVLKYAQILMEVIFAHVYLGICWEPITNHVMVGVV